MNSYYKEQKTPELLALGVQFFFQKTEPRTVATRSHIHDTLELLYVLNGEFHITVDEREADVSSGDMIFIRSNCIHTIIAKDTAENEYLVLKIEGTNAISLFPESKIGKYGLHISVFGTESKFIWRKNELSGSDIKRSFEKLMEELYSPSVTRELVAKAESMYIISEIVRELEAKSESTSLPSPIYSQIYQSALYVNRHFAEDISAREMSKRMNMSYSYFSRMFMKVTGTSFRHYLNLTRIRYAEHLLMTTDKSVTDVSAACGYNNVSYFIATYKSIKGTAPFRSKKVKQDAELHN